MLPRSLCTMLALAVGCSPVVAPPAEPGPAGEVRDDLTYTTSTMQLCVDPPEPAEPPDDFITSTTQPPVVFPRGAVLSTGALFFHPGGSTTVRTLSAVAAPTDSRQLIELPRGTLTVRISTQALTSSNPKVVVLRAPALPLSRYDLATTYEVRSGGGVAVQKLELVEANTGAVHDSHGGFDDYAPWPLSCEEKALGRFGPLPAGMPSFKWPENDFCDGEKCVQTRLAYLQAVHGTWRVTQMMDLVAQYPYSAQREWAWGRSGTDQNGDAVTERTSPRYWFGAYSAERFAVVRELFKDHLNVLREAKMDGIGLHLRCPAKGHHGCLGTYAHHTVKGYLNICPETWEDLDAWTTDSEKWSTWFDHIVAHETYHHHWVNIDGLGWKMVKDQLTHRHNSSCTSLSIEKHYSYWGYSPYDQKPRHLATYVNSDDESCGHRNVALRNVDSYNTFARLVGRMVWNKELWHWPEPAPPTPQPPTCESDPGCLCDATQGYYAPDGDFSENQYCSDHDGEATCVKTTFNASSTVGICVRCSDSRGPGCPCNDFQAPCDVGTCWGDDTGGTNASWGQCYVGTPPLWSCLADCDALYNHGECMLETNVFGQRARCVPEGTAGPDAANCWMDTGHIDPQTLECTDTPECGAGSGTGGQPDQTCASLGYPPYFVCDYSQRCVADL